MELLTNPIICISIPLILGFLSGFSTRRIVHSPWYRQLRKPWFNPPPYVFGPVWSILYISLGLSLYRYTTKYHHHLHYDNTALIIFFLQLLFNFLWSPLFFIFKKIKLALLDMSIMIILTIINIYLFYKVDVYAGLLILPYLVWICFAFLLTFNIMLLNTNFGYEDNTNERLIH